MSGAGPPLWMFLQFAVETKEEAFSACLVARRWREECVANGQLKVPAVIIKKKQAGMDSTILGRCCLACVQSLRLEGPAADLADALHDLASLPATAGWRVKQVAILEEGVDDNHAHSITEEFVTALTRAIAAMNKTGSSLKALHLSTAPLWDSDLDRIAASLDGTGELELHLQMPCSCHPCQQYLWARLINKNGFVPIDEASGRLQREAVDRRQGRILRMGDVADMVCKDLTKQRLDGVSQRFRKMSAAADREQMIFFLETMHRCVISMVLQMQDDWLSETLEEFDQEVSCMLDQTGSIAEVSQCLEDGPDGG